MVSSSNTKVEGPGSVTTVSVVGALTALLEAVLSVSIAKLKCVVIKCSALNGVSIDV